MDVVKLLRYMSEEEASDLHLKPGLPPVVRVDGELVQAPFDPLTKDDAEAAAAQLLPKHKADEFRTTNEADAVYRIALRRALAAGDATALQLHFDVSVLQRYRETGGFSIIRTNTVGRVKKDGAWTLDFGIAPDETSVHVAFSEVARLPEIPPDRLLLGEPVHAESVRAA